MVDVHDGRALAQFGQVANHGIAEIGGLAAAAALHHALTEQLTLGNQGHARAIDLHALVERGDGNGDLALAGCERRPAVNRFWLELNAGQQLGQRLAATGGLGDKQRPACVLIEKALQCL